MKLIEQWKDLIQNQTEETFEDFWTEYSQGEIDIYKEILASGSSKLSGNFSQLASHFNVSPVIFMGFLDGVAESLKNSIDLDAIDADSQIDLDIDLPLLYLNMLKVPAEHLYQLEEWQTALSPEELAEIQQQYKRSKTVVKGEKIGRNQPCTCGSGKKYKHCCGR